MPIKDTAKYRILSRVVQRSYGKSSEVRYPTHFLTMTMPFENIVQVKFMMIVNFGHENMMFELKTRYKNEALDRIKDAAEKTMADYKIEVEKLEAVEHMHVPPPYEEAPKKTVVLKLQENSIQESIEYVSTSLYSPKKTAYYRMTALIDVT